jgi:arylsulfate sulfotransferase
MKHQSDGDLFRPAYLAAVAVLSVSCSAPPPAINELALDSRPSETVPLAARVTFQTDRPTSVALEISDGQRTRQVDPRMPVGTDHDVPILGLRPDTAQTVTVIVTDEDGATARSDALPITTDPLPEDFPTLDVRLSTPERMEPGFLLLEPSFMPQTPGLEGDSWLIVLDATGEVVWFYRASHGVADVKRISNGNLLYGSGNSGLYEIDMLGNVASHWTSELVADDGGEAGGIELAIDTLHHESLETPWGNLMALTTELRTIDDYPTSETDPAAPRAPGNVVGDKIVEFTREGEIVREIRLLDLFDPHRIGYGSVTGGYWRPLYGRQVSEPRDWSHSNGISLDSTGRYLLLSMRYQGVAKIDLETNELVWILADHAGWGADWRPLLLEPRGELLWPADQHAPMYTPQGTVLMFDNGSNRARPFDPPMPVAESFSRAAEYRIDEDNMEVEEVWSYGGPGDEQYYGWRVGDADWMPNTGNVLITYGGLSKDAAGNISDRPTDHHWVRIVEVTHETPAQKVFELFVDDERPTGWLSFQAEHLQSLYP